MFIVIHNLFGDNNGSKAYYRKQGTYCFDFVSDKKYASDLTEEECTSILTSRPDYYLKRYNADKMTIES